MVRVVRGSSSSSSNVGQGHGLARRSSRGREQGGSSSAPLIAYVERMAGTAIEKGQRLRIPAATVTVVVGDVDERH